MQGPRGLNEVWVDLNAFPGYAVSDQGRVANDMTRRIMSLSHNQQGYCTVGLRLNGRQYTRSVTRLVADAFLPNPHGSETFNSVIHRDGDKNNLRVTNLLWRPRWFTVKYHKQFEHYRFHRKLHPGGYAMPIEDVDSGEQYDNTTFAAIQHGLLEVAIVLSIQNGTTVFPTRQKFRLLG